MVTKIEWTDETWNPVTGCTPISPGCKNCYAKRMARRLAGRFGYPGVPHHFDVTLHPDRLEQPLKWKKPRRVFVCSMGDLFHQDVYDDFLIDVFVRMGEAHQHTYQLLTKRPERMFDFISKSTWGLSPLRNVQFGISISTQSEMRKVAELCKVPAVVRFVSIEPMLGPVNFGGGGLYGDGWFTEYDPYENSGRYPCFFHGIDWVICGAETGPGKRPMELDWARSLRDQCKAVGVPFFMKKVSNGNVPQDLMIREFPSD
jgi:protein gp37